MSVDYGKKKAPLRERVLELLSDLEWHSWRSLHQIGGVRYSARLLELKRLGYKIESVETGKLNDGDGKKYRLISKDRGAPKGKKVKVFIEESDVEALIALIVAVETFSHAEGIILPRSRLTLLTLKSALQSFRTNKDKL